MYITHKIRRGKVVNGVLNRSTNILENKMSIHYLRYNAEVGYLNPLPTPVTALGKHEYPLPEIKC